jgi:hypothetical protein
MKRGLEPDEGAYRGVEGSNLSTGTPEDGGGVSNEERSSLGRFLFVWIPGLTAIFTTICKRSYCAKMPCPPSNPTFPGPSNAIAAFNRAIASWCMLGSTCE